MTETLPLFLDGKPEPSAAAEFLELKAPATGKLYARVPLCEREEVDRAVRVAQAAFPSWRDTPVLERARVLFRYRQMLEAEADGLARLIVHDHGKVLSDARGEVQRGIEVVEFACGMPTLMQGSTVEDVARGIDCRTIRQPLGVCVGITPFNFPAMVPMWMVPVAVAAGNTFVLKPSERVPRTALRLAELFKEAGLPDGVFNILHGDRRTVDALIEHPGTRAVSFVGSEPVARAVYRKAGEQGKRVQALSGAKNHLVVLPDCDMDKTIDGIMGGGYGSAGERCMAVSVIVAVGAVADPLVQRIRQAAEALQVGEGTQPGSEMGPLITAEHKRRVTGYIGTGEREGAQLTLDGRSHPAAGGPGNFVGPTLFDHVQPDMAIYRDEIFGPVLSVVRVNTLDDAIALVNANTYGNGTAIFTNDGGAARTFQNQVSVGMVGVNVSVPVPLAFFPFSGWKGSFFGDLHVHGRDGVNFYTETKVVTARWFGDGSAAARNMTIRLG
jgi:malonate-semialdehyde dehydrogenase (acetylating)/methylmalonate-semialdehyde dehydrogenase